MTVIVDSTREFFEKMASGDIRYALELFTTLLSSGHTDLVGIITMKIAANSKRTIQSHEVLKSIALGKHEGYNSKKSFIINLFRVYNDGFHSHFVAIRILEVLWIRSSNTRKS
ncbi:hypothetical protein [Metabacillus idriensis]|uniref:hypothetical protein n=1 Tax=Metabacillus idriensis TaxID=324768 RepID=UPI00174E78B0|nr:hypothetical protein [Metabacillus idriensis]